MIDAFAVTPDRDFPRESVRAQLRALRSECEVLGSYLTAVAPWRGAAQGVYQIRLLRVRARLAAALAALEAAEFAL